MLWFGKKQDKIRVEYFENGSDKPLVVSTTPIGQLPETIKVGATLTIAGRKWSVVDATPKLKSDFQQSKKLRVVLSAVQMVDPKDVLFSLPTINDRLCALQEAKSLDRMLVIHEDDWRQIEFVSEKLLSDVETEISSVRTIHQTKRDGMGFTGLHVRKLIENPIEDGVIAYSELKSHVGIAKEYSGFGIGGCESAAKNGFAFETNDGLQFYGVLSDAGNVIFLCLVKSDEIAAKCGDLMKSFHVIGVDWCKCQIVRQ